MLWALFAAAAVIAWRATSGRQDDARLLETIVEGSVDGVFVKDLEGRYILVNEAAARLLGAGPQAPCSASTDEELFGDAASAARRARDEAVLATGETRRYWRTGSDERHRPHAVGHQGAVPRRRRAGSSA